MNTKITAAIAFIIILAILSASYVLGMLGFDLASFLAFIAFLGAIIYADRDKVKTEGIVFIRRTKRGRNFIDNVTRRRKKTLKILATIGVIVAIPVLVLGSWFLIGNAIDITTGAREGGVKLLLPGPVSSPVNTPLIFVMPWWIWVIGVAVVIIPHEFFHGIMCRLDNIRIKSVGWLLLVIIPGAFVEPDEAQLKKAKRSIKLKVYAAGSFANLLTALVIIIVMIAMFSSLLAPAGAFVSKENNTGFIVDEINGTVIHNQEEFYKEISKVHVGDSVRTGVINTYSAIPKFSGDKFITPDIAFLASGNKVYVDIPVVSEPSMIKTMPVFVPLFGDVFVFWTFYMLFFWIFIFCLGVGVVNLLPIKPLDGGLIFEEICGKFTKRSKIIVKAVTIIMLAVLIFNLIGPMFF
jgi:membrane-associated protease RseP (regulator of RpoE activity)